MTATPPSTRLVALPRLLGLLMLLTPLLILGCAAEGHRPRATWTGDGATVTLEYRGEARGVFAAGDWNGWDPLRHPFQWRGGDRWLLELALPAGEHRYLLAVETDSSWEWRVDPANPLRVRDGDGRELSLLRVGNGAPASE